MKFRPIAYAAAAASSVMVAAGFSLAAVAVGRRLLRPSFHGKVAVITGGSRGLGLTMARRLSSEGAKLLLVARDRDELERAATELRGRSAQVEIVAADVTELESAPAIIAAAQLAFGRVDLLINCAGVILVGPLATMDEDDFELALATHFWGPLRLMREALPLLRQTRGRIINISSIGCKIAVPHMALTRRASLPWQACRMLFGWKCRGRACP